MQIPGPNPQTFWEEASEPSNLHSQYPFPGHSDVNELLAALGETLQNINAAGDIALLSVTS